MRKAHSRRFWCLLTLLLCTRSQAALQSCAVSASGVAFGGYQPLDAQPADAVGTISVVCTVSVVPTTAAWDVRLSTGSSGSYANRTLSSGGQHLDYNLYTSISHSVIWGDGSGGSSYISGSSLLAIGISTMSYSVYGRITAAQDRPPGSYSDIIVVTVNY